MTTDEKVTVVRNASTGGAFCELFERWTSTHDDAMELAVVRDALALVEEILGPVDREERALLVGTAFYEEVVRTSSFARDLIKHYVETLS